MICFVHIPKAGGTTLLNIFQNNYISFVSITSWYKGNAFDDYNYFTSNEAKYFFKVLPFTKGFGGHSLKHWLNYEQVLNHRIDYVTFLRDPIKRYISHYYHMKRTRNLDFDFDGYLKTKQFNNYFTRSVSVNADLDEAKKILIEKFTFVGLTERYDESLVLMKKELELPKLCINYEKMNVNPNISYKENGISNNKVILGKISKNNALDIELYNFVKNNIYNNYVNNYGSTLRKDVKKFKKSNDIYKFNKIKMFYSRIYRILISRNLQFVLHYVFHDTKGMFRFIYLKIFRHFR